MDRYTSPAQAEFLDTYVPIPFEQLYTLGREANARVDKAMTELSSTLDKWSEFRSPSKVDTDAWYEETTAKAQPIVENLSRNLDLIKTPEGRSQIYSIINNVDRSKLSKLLQSKEGLEQRQKVNQQLMVNGRFNPLWHDVDFTNYNTSESGIFNDVAPLAYTSIKDLTDKYVNNLKDSYLGTTGGYMYSGVTKNQIKEILDKNLSGILATPEAQKHIEVYMSQNPEASQKDAVNWLMDRAITDNLEYVRTNLTADPFTLAQIRKGGSESSDPRNLPDIYQRTLQSGILKENELFNAPDMFTNMKRIMSEQDRLTKISLAKATEYQDLLDSGEISQAEYDRYVKNLKTEYTNNLSKISPAKAYQQDIKDMWNASAGLGESSEITKDNAQDYINGANRVLAALTSTAPGKAMQDYNLIASNGKVIVNNGDITSNAYVRGDSKGLRFNVDFVAKLAGEKPKIPFTIEDQNGKKRDIAKDLINGNIKNVLVVPRNSVMAVRDHNSTGQPVLAQMVSVKIPLTSLVSLGYDKKSVEAMFKKSFGISPENGIKIKPDSTMELNQLQGTEREGVFEGFANWLTGTNKHTATAGSLTDTYYTIDAIEYIDPESVQRSMWGSDVDKTQGGAVNQKNLYGDRIYQPYMGIQ